MHATLHVLKPEMSVRRFGRIVFLRVADLFYLPLFRLGVAYIADRSTSVDKCRFWGSPSLIDLSTKAMDLIAREDTSLFSSLSSHGGWFWHHPTNSVSAGTFKRVYSVTDRYLKFGVHGVAARIVWAHFEMTALKGVYLLPSEKELAADFYNIIRTQTFNWLQQHKFPEELTLFFAEKIRF